ncbi:hypothetical protein JST97_06495 [bacterium]|nr:hypothetical protein [bacterium]
MIHSMTSPLATAAGTKRPLAPTTPRTQVEKADTHLGAAKWALAGVGAVSVFAPMAQAQAAQVKILPAHAQKEKAQAEFQKLVQAYREVEAEIAAEKAADAAIPRVAPQPQATYVLPGSGRLELFKPGQAPLTETEMGVNLGHGLVLDANGTLSLLLQSGSEVRDFQQLERTDGGVLTTQVRHEGDIYRAQGPLNERVNVQQKENGAVIRSHEGFYAIAGGGGPSTFIQGHQGQQQMNYRVDWKGNEATVSLPNQEVVKVTVGQDEARVERNGITTDYAISARHTIPQDSQLTVDRQFRVGKESEQLQKLKARLDAVEPGFTSRHPITLALLEHTLKNADFADLVKTEKALKPLEVAVPAASALTGVEVGLALTQQAQALSMGARAMALKGTAVGMAQQAYAAKAGAEAALNAGNIQQAVSLGQKAQALAGQAQAVGGQAKAVGGQAMQIGEHAKHAAHVAKTASIVGGAMAIVDGLVTGYEGYKQIDAVEGAMRVASARLQQIAEEETPEVFAQALSDYEEVRPVLLKLARHADVTVNIGGVKIGCGALTLGSAFMSGPVAPVVAGAVGSACYLGTAIYDHYRD